MNNDLTVMKKEKFGLFEASLATFLFVALNFLFMESFVSFGRQFGVSELGLLFAQFLVEALFGVAAVIVAWLCKINIVKAAGMHKKVNLMMVFYSAIIAFCSIIFFANLTGSFMEFLTLLGYKSSGASLNIDSFNKYIGYIIAACVTPAVCEELLFRGAIQSGLKKYGKWISIISASLIFMLMHGGPEQTVHQFIVGVVVGFIFFETGNLWLGVLVHFFNNFISVTELYVLSMLTKETEDAFEQAGDVGALTASEAWIGFMINLFIALVMAAIGYFIVKTLIKKLCEEDKKLNGEQIALNSQTQTVLIDGQEIETGVSISNSDEQTEQNAQTSTVNEKTEEDKQPMDLKTKILFAIPIAWMILSWMIALINGLL